MLANWTRPFWASIKIGAVLTCLIQCVACSRPYPVMVPQSPPEIYLQPTPPPKTFAATNAGELLKLLVEYDEAYRRCERDKAAVRAWSQGAKP